MKKSKKYLIVILCCFVMISCRSKEIGNEINILNQSFLMVTDTLAYNGLSLRSPPPPFTLENNQKISDTFINGNLAIIISDTLSPIGQWQDFFSLPLGKGFSRNFNQQSI